MLSTGVPFGPAQDKQNKPPTSNTNVPLARAYAGTVARVGLSSHRRGAVAWDFGNSVIGVCLVLRLSSLHPASPLF
jgi:hypothetical protein